MKKDPVVRLHTVEDYQRDLYDVTDRNATKVVSVDRKVEAKKSALPTVPKYILLVDENYLTETLKIIFQNAGYYVETAANGVQALKKTMERYFDLIIMEANLPDSTGREIAQVIRNMNGKTKVILMTGDEYEVETLKTASAEVDNVLLKPFAPEELILAARRALMPKNPFNNEMKLKLPLA